MKGDKLAVMVGSTIAFMLMAFVVLADTPRASATAPETPICNGTKAKKQNLGSELMVFASPVRPMVEIERISSPLGNGSAAHASYGPEFDPKTHVLRPGKTYHIWARMTNYGDVDQTRNLSVRKDEEGIDALIHEYKTDVDTLHRLGEAGWSSLKNPITFATGESKTFLVVFTLGENMPEGNWQLSLVLE